MSEKEALESWAAGALDEEAGILLLTHCTVAPRLMALLVSRVPSTGSVWVDAGRSVECVESGGLSGGELRLARLVLGFFGQAPTTPLGDLVTGIGDRDIEALLNAIAHAAGWHERGTAARIDGLFDISSAVSLTAGGEC